MVCSLIFSSYHIASADFHLNSSHYQAKVTAGFLTIGWVLILEQGVINMWVVTFKWVVPICAYGTQIRGSVYSIPVS